MEIGKKNVYYYYFFHTHKSTETERWGGLGGAFLAFGFWPAYKNIRRNQSGRCLEYFHRFQTIKKLQEVRDLVGHESLSLAFETFDSIKNAGYSLSEIIETDTTVLIDREEYIRYQAEVSDDDDEDGSSSSSSSEGHGDLGALSDDDDESSDDESEQLQKAIERSRASEVEFSAGSGCHRTILCFGD